MRGVDKRALGKMLRERRLELGLSQLELSEKSGLSTGMVSKLETGNHNATVDVLNVAATALNMTVEAVRVDDDGRAARELFTLYQRVPQRVQEVVLAMLRLNQAPARQRRKRRK